MLDFYSLGRFAVASRDMTELMPIAALIFADVFKSLGSNPEFNMRCSGVRNMASHNSLVHRNVGPKHKIINVRN